MLMLYSSGNYGIIFGGFDERHGLRSHDKEMTCIFFCKIALYSRVQKSIENSSVCSKMALAEVGVSLPRRRPALLLLAPGY